MIPTTYNYDYSFNKMKYSNHPNNLNIIERFSILRDYTKKLKQPFKTKSYQTAIDNLKMLDFDITLSNSDYLIKHKLLGKKLYDKVIEYLTTGGMKAVENVKKEFKSNEILDIKGFGKTALEKLKKQGIYTIEDLIKNEGNLNLNNIQKIGLKYNSDLKKVISRNEIKLIYNTILKPSLKGQQHSLVGSYRREQPTSGDIDLIIGCDNKICMSSIKDIITKNKHYITTIYNGITKFSFLVRYLSIIRQIDILMVPMKSYYIALVHFTGSGPFNEYIRTLSKKKGITVNEFYISKNGIKYYPKSEQEVFKLIGIKYLEPKYREPKNVVFV